MELDAKLLLAGCMGLGLNLCLDSTVANRRVTVTMTRMLVMCAERGCYFGWALSGRNVRACESETYDVTDC